jgi:hypothetical protein
MRQGEKSKDQAAQKNPMIRMESLRKIMRGNFNEKDWEDSDSDVVDENVGVNNKVEYFEINTQKWVTCNVTMSVGELLCIRNESEGVHKWMDNLSECLRASNKKRNINRNNEL